MNNNKELYTLTDNGKGNVKLELINPLKSAKGYQTKVTQLKTNTPSLYCGDFISENHLIYLDRNLDKQDCMKVFDIEKEKQKYCSRPLENMSQ